MEPSCLWQHPTTGAKFFVASEMVADNIKTLEKYNIFNIINAKEPDSLLFFERDPRFTYMRFDIQGLADVQAHFTTPEQIMNFVHPIHTFIDSCLERGENVMVHCMAGAHRAGTTGVSYLMKAAKMPYQEARKAARICRRIIDPFGMLEWLV